jgi:hypothetical protein
MVRLASDAAAIRVTTLPGGPLNHHWTKNVIASPDGKKLYVTVGSNSNVAEHGIDKEEGRAAIWEVDAERGTSRIYASGLRNPNGLAWEPDTGALWTAVNERDELGSDLVPDYMTSVRDGGFYGWPYSYFGQHVDTRVQPQRPDLVATAIAPDFALGPHTASLGLAASRGTSLPDRFKQGMFVGQHGSWNRKPRSGYKVIFVPFDRGRPAGEPVDVLTAFVSDEGEAMGRRSVSRSRAMARYWWQTMSATSYGAWPPRRPRCNRRVARVRAAEADRGRRQVRRADAPRFDDVQWEPLCDPPGFARCASSWRRASLTLLQISSAQARRVSTDNSDIWTAHNEEAWGHAARSAGGRDVRDALRVRQQNQPSSTGDARLNGVTRRRTSGRRSLLTNGPGSAPRLHPHSSVRKVGQLTTRRTSSTRSDQLCGRRVTVNKLSTAIRCATTITRARTSARTSSRSPMLQPGRRRHPDAARHVQRARSIGELAVARRQRLPGPTCNYPATFSSSDSSAEPRNVHVHRRALGKLHVLRDERHGDRHTRGA